MADPLSISASVAGLLSLVIQVTNGTYQYVARTQNARSSVTALLKELRSLKTVLIKLDDLTSISDVPNTDVSIVSILDVESCTTEIEEIQGKLKSRLDKKSKMNVAQRLMWPLREDQTVQMIKSLHGYVDIFHLALSMDNLALNKATLTEIQTLRSEIKLDARQKSILEWLSPESQSSVHESISSQRHDDTGQWFLEMLRDVGWLSETNTNRVLWCRGVLGVGKTTLCSLVIDHAATTDTGFIVAYYYLNYKHEGFHDIEAIVSCLVSQLLMQSPALWSSVDLLYKKYESNRRKPSYEEVVRILLSLPNPSKIIIAIDALDETSDSTRATLIGLFRQLSEAGVRLFLTSRPMINVKDLRSYATDFDISAQDHDLETYARTKMRTSENFQAVAGERADMIVDEIVGLMVSQAAGMFLLVVFQTDFVCNQTTVREMLDAAKKMPTDPDFIYSRTMNLINSQPRAQVQLATKILMWLTFAGEALTLQQLVEALAIEDQTKDIDPMNAPSPTMFTKVCRGLVVTNESNNSIQLAHRTVQDYLEHLFAPDAGKIHYMIWAACLTYLSFDIFRTTSCKTSDQRRQRRIIYCFAQYAAPNIGRHFSHASRSEDMLDRMYQFITCKPLMDNFIQMQDYVEYCIAEETTELHLAALINDIELLELVITRSPHLLNEVDETGRTALGVAVERGFEEIVRSLLNAGATLHLTAGETLLNCAARKRHDKLLELLFSYECQTQDQESQQTERLKPRPTSLERQLFLAVMKGDHEAVQIAILQGTNPDARDTDGGTSLQWAAWYGYDSIIETLLNHGADIKAADFTSGRQALHEAAEHGNFSTTKLLLERGSDVDAKDTWQWSPLHRASCQGGEKVVALLLDHGADVEAKTDVGQTALDLACEEGQFETIRVLLRSLGNRFPGDFDAEMLDFGIPETDRMKVYEILREHMRLSGIAGDALQRRGLQRNIGIKH